MWQLIAPLKLFPFFLFFFWLYFGTLSPLWPFLTKCALPRIEIHYSPSEKEVWVLDLVQQTMKVCDKTSVKVLWSPQQERKESLAQS